MDLQFAGRPVAGPYSLRTDIDHMPDTPKRGAHHRRAHSETFFRFPDDILLDTDVDINLSAFDFVPDVAGGSDNNSNSNSNNGNNNVGSIPMAVDSSKPDESSGADRARAKPLGAAGHFRSLSVDADFFDGLGFTAGGAVDGSDSERFGGKSVMEKRGPHHRHSNSMDGSMSSFEADSMMLIDGVKKAMGPDRLAELALIDPKRAKRILANRQSAARSKERKIRYTSELERKVQTLQTEATTLSAQVTMLQRDTTGLTVENKELKLRLQAMEQQAHLRDALNEALREEVQRLKIATGQTQAVNGNSFSRGLPPQYSSHHPQAYFSGQQTQQQQLHVPQSSPNNQAVNGHPQPTFLDFNQRV
ncbi:transcription factor VIP1 [Malania oleifera]|uniref:transcription factor VIP1 n=1 Tax=Malania oleifera TaxID=397392 RepID=UPI0025ADACAC|nr:transcription factor VIP1 [Malania oleifera]